MGKLMLQTLGVAAMAVCATAVLIGARLVPALARLPDPPSATRTAQKAVPTAALAASAPAGAAFRCC
jgi:hypothetical protein